MTVTSVVFFYQKWVNRWNNEALQNSALIAVIVYLICSLFSVLFYLFPFTYVGKLLVNYARQFLNRLFRNKPGLRKSWQVLPSASSECRSGHEGSEVHHFHVCRVLPQLPAQFGLRPVREVRLLQWRPMVRVFGRAVPVSVGSRQPPHTPELLKEVPPCSATTLQNAVWQGTLGRDRNHRVSATKKFAQTSGTGTRAEGTDAGKQWWLPFALLLKKNPSGRIQFLSYRLEQPWWEGCCHFSEAL